MLRARMSELHGASVGSDVQPRLLVGGFPVSPYPILNEALNVLRTQLYGRG
jgi:hypothetical protein